MLQMCLSWSTGLNRLNSRVSTRNACQIGNNQDDASTIKKSIGKPCGPFVLVDKLQIKENQQPTLLLF